MSNSALAGEVDTNVATTKVDIEVKGLTKSYGSGPAIFSDVSFSVPQGQAVALIGANGTGKSTLLRSCLRLIEVSTGEVKLLGKNISKIRGQELRETRAAVGFVFQKHNLVPRLSVLSNVLHGALASKSTPRLWYQGFAPASERARALDCLDQVGLADLANRRADGLSGGQSQRVAVARALMQEPKMIFADEPVASLDPSAGEEVMNLFLNLTKEKGLTFLFVSHHLEHALRFADRIIGLRNGGLELDAPSSSHTIESLKGIYG